MITPRSCDARHKIQQLRLLTALIDDPYLAQLIVFKGGTCATLLGYLDRFSVDLDFDIVENADKKKINKLIMDCASSLGLTIQKKSARTLFYVFKYKSKPGERNSLKLSLISGKTDYNLYEKKYIADIDRFVNCETVETMFAHKLVALTDRYKKNKTVAFRDIYDIHHFFEKGYFYIPEIIKFRTGKNIIDYLQEVVQFIEKKVSEKQITEEMNFLLPKDKFEVIRKRLKQETIMLVRDEIKRLEKVNR